MSLEPNEAAAERSRKIEAANQRFGNLRMEMNTDTEKKLRAANSRFATLKAQLDKERAEKPGPVEEMIKGTSLYRHLDEGTIQPLIEVGKKLDSEKPLAGLAQALNIVGSFAGSETGRAQGMATLIAKGVGPSDALKVVNAALNIPVAAFSSGMEELRKLSIGGIGGEQVANIIEAPFILGHHLYTGSRDAVQATLDFAGIPREVQNFGFDKEEAEAIVAEGDKINEFLGIVPLMHGLKVGRGKAIERIVEGKKVPAEKTAETPVEETKPVEAPVEEAPVVVEGKMKERPAPEPKKVSANPTGAYRVLQASRRVAEAIKRGEEIKISDLANKEIADMIEGDKVNQEKMASLITIAQKHNEKMRKIADDLANPVDATYEMKPGEIRKKKTIRVNGENVEVDYVETYKGKDIVQLPDGSIAVFTPPETAGHSGNLFEVALDDSKSSGRKRHVESANNPETAKKYIDWVEKNDEGRLFTKDAVEQAPEKRQRFLTALKEEKSRAQRLVDKFGVQQDAKNGYLLPDGRVVPVEKISHYQAADELIPKSERGTTSDPVLILTREGIIRKAGGGGYELSRVPTQRQVEVILDDIAKRTAKNKDAYLFIDVRSPVAGNRLGDFKVFEGDSGQKIKAQVESILGKALPPAFRKQMEQRLGPATETPKGQVYELSDIDLSAEYRKQFPEGTENNPTAAAVERGKTLTPDEINARVDQYLEMTKSKDPAVLQEAQFVREELQGAISHYSGKPYKDMSKEQLAKEAKDIAKPLSVTDFDEAVKDAGKRGKEAEKTPEQKKIEVDKMESEAKDMPETPPEHPGKGFEPLTFGADFGLTNFLTGVWKERAFVTNAFAQNREAVNRALGILGIVGARNPNMSKLPKSVVFLTDQELIAEARKSGQIMGGLPPEQIGGWFDASKNQIVIPMKAVMAGEVHGTTTLIHELTHAWRLRREGYDEYLRKSYESDMFFSKGLAYRELPVEYTSFRAMDTFEKKLNAEMATGSGMTGIEATVDAGLRMVIYRIPELDYAPHELVVTGKRSDILKSIGVTDHPDVMMGADFGIGQIAMMSFNLGKHSKFLDDIIKGRSISKDSSVSKRQNISKQFARAAYQAWTNVFFSKPYGRIRQIELDLNRREAGVVKAIADIFNDRIMSRDSQKAIAELRYIENEKQGIFTDQELLSGTAGRVYSPQEIGAIRTLREIQGTILDIRRDAKIYEIDISVEGLREALKDLATARKNVTGDPVKEKYYDRQIAKKLADVTDFVDRRREIENHYQTLKDQGYLTLRRNGDQVVSAIDPKTGELIYDHTMSGVGKYKIGKLVREFEDAGYTNIQHHDIPSFIKRYGTRLSPGEFEAVVHQAGIPLSDPTVAQIFAQINKNFPTNSYEVKRNYTKGYKRTPENLKLSAITQMETYAASYLRNVGLSEGRRVMNEYEKTHGKVDTRLRNFAEKWLNDEVVGTPRTLGSRASIKARQLTYVVNLGLDVMQLYLNGVAQPILINYGHFALPEFGLKGFEVEKYFVRGGQLFNRYFQQNKFGRQMGVSKEFMDLAQRLRDENVMTAEFARSLAESEIKQTSKLGHSLSIFHRAGEIVTRGQVVAEAYLIGKEKLGLKGEELHDFIVKQVDITQGKFTRGEAPGIVRGLGEAGRAGYQFASYTNIWFENMALGVKALRKGNPGAFTRQLTALAIIGGLSALPFASSAKILYKKLTGNDPDEEFTDFMENNNLGAFRDLALYGVTAAASPDLAAGLSKREEISVPILDQIIGPFGYDFKDIPAVGTMARPFTAISDAASGDLYRAAEGFAPVKPIKTGARTLRYMNEGIKDRSGKVIVHRRDIELPEEIMTFLGLQTKKELEKRE